MEIEEKIRQFIAEDVLFSENGFPYDDDASFLRKGILDSLGVMELVAFVGKEFGVSVDPLEITPEHFDSVNRLASYVRSKTAFTSSA